MSQEKEHFYGLSVAPPPINHNPWWLDRAIEILCWACLGALIALALPGCAREEEGVKACYIRPMGQTDDGFVVIAQSCMSPEAFQKATE